MTSTLLARIETRLGGQRAHLLRGMVAYGSAEIAGRIARLATTVVLARQLTPEIVGQAALALSLFELVRVLERVGTGQQIVLASEAELPAVCNTVRRVYLVWTGALMVLQLLVAASLWLVFDAAIAGAMLAALSFVFVFMAGGHVQYFLAMRAKMVGRLARIGAAQTMADQGLTLALMLLWPSPWAIVLPKLLVAPLWLWLARKAHRWEPDRRAGFLPLRRILRSSAALLLADTLAALRSQGDNLIVAALLGTSALGRYYFAYNAGLGIVTALVGAFGSVAFPLLARAAPGPARDAAQRSVTIAGLALFVPLVALQALAARWYVPIIFGARWSEVAPLVSILCLGGVALALGQIVSGHLRAQGRMEADAANAMLTCSATLAGLTLGALTGSLTHAAIGAVGGGTLASLVLAARHLLPARTLRADVRIPAARGRARSSRAARAR